MTGTGSGNAVPRPAAQDSQKKRCMRRIGNGETNGACDNIEEKVFRGTDTWIGFLEIYLLRSC